MSIPMPMAFCPKAHLAEGQINNNDDNNCYYSFIYLCTDTRSIRPNQREQGNIIKYNKQQIKRIENN
jgi:hypothetical protein